MFGVWSGCGDVANIVAMVNDALGIVFVKLHGGLRVSGVE